MRKINKPIIPQKLLDAQAEIEAKLLAKGKDFPWHNQHYSEPIKEELLLLYNQKCAFCETKFSKNTKDIRYSTIEHYRPKVDYWWLGNEWTNLFPVCKYCNNKKDDIFDTNNPLQKKKNLKAIPIENESLNRQKCNANYFDLVNEIPQLLHPEIDQPEDFLEFTIAGKAIQKAETLENRNIQQTLVILNLPTNEEDRLEKITECRGDFMNNVLNFLKYASPDYTDKELRLSFFAFFEKLLIGTNIKSQYSLLGLQMFEKFEEFLLPSINDETLKTIVLEAYKLFIHENINH